MVLAEGSVSFETFKSLIANSGGHIDKVTQIVDKRLYEVSFGGRKARDDFASFWRNLNGQDRLNLTETAGA